MQQICFQAEHYDKDKGRKQRASAVASLCYTAECRNGLASKHRRTRCAPSHGAKAVYEAQIRPRSGLALKHGITVLNTPGTIDADYRGEVGVCLINLSQDDFVVNDGERIAQMVIARHEQGDFVVVEELDETERGAGGYGHTGLK